MKPFELLLENQHKSINQLYVTNTSCVWQRKLVEVVQFLEATIQGKTN